MLFYFVDAVIQRPAGMHTWATKLVLLVAAARKTTHHGHLCKYQTWEVECLRDVGSEFSPGWSWQRMIGTRALAQARRGQWPWFQNMYVQAESPLDQTSVVPSWTTRVWLNPSQRAWALILCGAHHGLVWHSLFGRARFHSIDLFGKWIPVTPDQTACPFFEKARVLWRSWLASPPRECGGEDTDLWSGTQDGDLRKSSHTRERRQLCSSLVLPCLSISRHKKMPF